MNDSPALGLSPAQVAWQGLGDQRSTPLHLVSVDVITVETTFRQPVRTSTGTHLRRPWVLVAVTARQAGRASSGEPVVGWGECAALADSTYDAEDASSASATLVDELVPQLIEQVVNNHGVLVGPTTVVNELDQNLSTPLALAALEMAVADVLLRAISQSLADLLSVATDSVPVGAVLGITSDLDELVAQVRSLVDSGYGRVKLKIGPGWDHEPIGALRTQFPQLLIQVDANGAYSFEAVEHLCGLDPYGLACLEQPFAADDLESHAALARRSSTPICLDESLHSPESVRRAIDLGACDVVCVKPARLGGIANALEVQRDCLAAGVPLWVGGMFESSYARSVNATISGMGGFTLPGDLAPPALALVDDLSEPLVLEGRPLRARLHGGPGMGPAPDRERVGRLTSHSSHLTP